MAIRNLWLDVSHQTNLMKTHLFLKEYLVFNGCFWLFSKIKKLSEASFWCTFSAWFFHKNVPYLILYQWTKFQCHTLFLSQDIKQNVLSSYLDSWWCHKFYDVIHFSLINLKGNGWHGKKTGRQKYKDLNISRKKRTFRMKQKTFFSFWKAFLWWKIKTW